MKVSTLDLDVAFIKCIKNVAVYFKERKKEGATRIQVFGLDVGFFDRTFNII